MDAGFIKFKLESDDRWLYRGILAIYSRQTIDEKCTCETVDKNGVGFNRCDAEFLSSLATQLIKWGGLSIKQRVIARKKMLKYAGQLERIAGGAI